MPASLVVWILTALILVGVLTQKWWEPRLEARGVPVRRWPWRWWLAGYPATALRIVTTWRRLAYLNGLSVSMSPDRRVIGRDLVVQGQALKPKPARLTWPMPTATGLTLRVLLHPGQTPAPFYAATQAMEHTWRVHSVRVTSPRRGQVVIEVTARDPLTEDAPSVRSPAPGLLAADVGVFEDGGPWLIDLRRTPHWLVTGATQSGKSSLLAALVLALAPQRVGLVGIDCKGGMELGLFGGRLSALAVDRTQALGVLAGVVDEIQARTRWCRSWDKRSVWELPEEQQPIPLVVIVDELAELYLTDGSRESRDQAEQCGTLLLRIAQLGAARSVADELEKHRAFWEPWGEEGWYHESETYQLRHPSRTTYTDRWNDAIKKAGLGDSGYTPKALRHYFASMAIAAGVPLYEVARWMGHSSTKVTEQVYAHLVDGADERITGAFEASLADAFRARLTVVGEDAA